MQNPFPKIHRFFSEKKILAFIFLGLYLAICIFLSLQLRFEEDITRLIPSGKDKAITEKILQNSTFSDRLLISISAEKEGLQDSLVAYADALLSQIQNNDSVYFDEIRGKVPDEEIDRVYNFVYNNLPIFLNERDYDAIASRISQKGIDSLMEDGYNRLISPTGFVTKRYFSRDPLNFNYLGLQKLREMQVGKNFGIYDNYLITEDRKNIILSIDLSNPSSETNKNAEFLSNLDTYIQDLDAEFTNVKAEYFGGVLYSIANANRIKKDIQLTLSIAGLLLLVLLISFYRKFWIPVLIFLPSLFGGLTALAFLSVFKESISAISLGIGSILLGISLDYALHISAHYRNNTNISELFEDITRPVLTSSLTTAAAFLCLIFVGSEALTDLGIFASVSVLASSVFSLILIPLLYHPNEQKITFIDRIASTDYSRLKFLPVLVGFMFLMGLFFFNQVGFNEDLSKLNFQPDDIKEKEERVEGLAEKDGEVVQVISYGTNIDEALQRNNELYMDLKRLDSNEVIQSYSSIGGVVLSTEMQNHRLAYWNMFWTPEKKEELEQNLKETSAEYGFRPQSFNRFYDLLNTDFTNIGLQQYQESGSVYLDDFLSEAEDFAMVSSSVSVEDSGELYQSMENSEGIFILDRKKMNEDLLSGLKSHFNELVWISLLVVFIILLISFRSLELALMTFLPVAVTWVIALGMMFILGIQFNILNIIISTFIFGLGLDYAIFMTNAALKEYESGHSYLQTYQASIIISAITTILGMGVLIFAKHPALRSISLISILGILSTILTVFVLQRWYLRKLLIEPTENNKPAFKFADLFVSLGERRKISGPLYYRREVLSNFRYKKNFNEVNEKFKSNRERLLKISELIDENDIALVLNSGLGVIPFFLERKHPGITIFAAEKDEDLRKDFRNTYQFQNGTIKLFDTYENLPEAETIVVDGNVDLDTLQDVIGRKTNKVIFVNSGMSSRWLTELNYEIIYRQNDILAFRKLD